MGQSQINPMYFKFCVFDFWVLWNDKFNSSILLPSIITNRKSNVTYTTNFIIVDLTSFYWFLLQPTINVTLFYLQLTIYLMNSCENFYVYKLSPNRNVCVCVCCLGFRKVVPHSQTKIAIKNCKYATCHIISYII